MSRREGGEGEGKEEGARGKQKGWRVSRREGGRVRRRIAVSHLFSKFPESRQYLNGLLCVDIV